MNWVWELDKAMVSPVYKVTLLAIADHCDDYGICYPSIKRLVEKTGLSRSTIKSHIKKLQATEVLVVMPVYEDSGARGTNLYKLQIEGVGQMLTPTGQTVDHTNNSNNNNSNNNNNTIIINNLNIINDYSNYPILLKIDYIAILNARELELALEVTESMLNQISYDKKKERYYRYNKNGNRSFYKNIWSVFRSWLNSAIQQDKSQTLKRVNNGTGQKRVSRGVSDFSTEQDYLPS